MELLGSFIDSIPKSSKESFYLDCFKWLFACKGARGAIFFESFDIIGVFILGGFSLTFLFPCFLEFVRCFATMGAEIIIPKRSWDSVVEHFLLGILRLTTSLNGLEKVFSILQSQVAFHLDHSLTVKKMTSYCVNSVVWALCLTLLSVFWVDEAVSLSSSQCVSPIQSQVVFKIMASW